MGVPVGATVDAGAADGASSCPSDLPASCPGAPPSYADQIAPIIQARCASCHAPGAVEGNHDYTTWVGLYAERGTILSQVYTCAMPQAGSTPLTASERTAVLDWLVCGAPP